MGVSMGQAYYQWNYRGYFQSLIFEIFPGFLSVLMLGRLPADHTGDLSQHTVLCIEAPSLLEMRRKLMSILV